MQTRIKVISTDRKNDGSKCIVHVTKNVNFQLSRTQFDGVIWKKPTTDNKYISKRVWPFIHQRMSLSGVKKKKILRRN